MNTYDPCACRRYIECDACKTRNHGNCMCEVFLQCSNCKKFYRDVMMCARGDSCNTDGH